jgi:hypothetical protein
MQHGKLLSLAIIGLAAYGCRSENSLAPSSFSPAQDKRARGSSKCVSSRKVSVAAGSPGRKG